MSWPWHVEAEDLERAQALLENVDNYKDSERQLNSVRYELAEAALEAQNYADARILYNALGSYKDSATKRKRCDYTTPARHRGRLCHGRLGL